MKKGSLIEAFEVKRTPLKVDNVSDYEIFSDKELLDSLRTKILEAYLSVMLITQYLAVSILKI